MRVPTISLHSLYANDKLEVVSAGLGGGEIRGLNELECGTHLDIGAVSRELSGERSAIGSVLAVKGIDAKTCCST